MSLAKRHVHQLGFHATIISRESPAMSTIRDRWKHQNCVEAIAEALDLSHNTKTNVPQALASAEVSCSDNPTDLRSLSDDHAHTEAKDISTNQHLDLYRGVAGENLCSGCNEIKDIFDFRKGIPARSWRTLDLLAHVDQWYQAPERIWKVTNKIDKACSFCLFLMDCASRMAIHTAVDLTSEDWFLALTVRLLSFVTGNASGEPWKGDSWTPVLELKLCNKVDDENTFMEGLRIRSPNDNPFKDRFTKWNDTHLILPVETFEGDNGKISDTLDWEGIVKWLEKCQSRHDYKLDFKCGKCRIDLTSTTLEDIPSFSLIDCTTKTIIPAAQIQNPDYVTLSYVWGGPLTTPQVTDPSTSLPVLPKSNERPRVVNDAMTVVQAIGYRYLWVDRYCIPQSDHNIKNIQIKNMGKIYSMSALTIIAAAGNDAEYGLPGVGSGPRLQPLWTTIRNGNMVMPVTYFKPPNDDILNSTWNSRGWTYQEALLSKRRLVFTDRHVYFQCESMQSVGHLDKFSPSPESEVFPFRKHYPSSMMGLGPSGKMIWIVINDYMKRMLSYEEDAIYAVQGILESFRDIYNVWFFYGLPVMSSYASDMDSFHNDSAMPDVLSLAIGTFRTVDSGTQEIRNSLLWIDYWRKDGSDLGTDVIKLCSDQSEVRRTGFPSWTWAGWRIVRGWNLRVGHWADTLYYIPDRCSFSIRLSYNDKDLSWPRDRRDIQQRSEIISQFPKFLIITGPVFDVTITCANAEDQHTLSNQSGHVVWSYASPPFLARVQSVWPEEARYKGPPFSPEEVGGRTIHLVALTLFYDVTEYYFKFHTLMLRPVGEDAHGQIYERVTCHRFYGSLFDTRLTLKDINLREMEVRIR